MTFLVAFSLFGWLFGSTPSPEKIFARVEPHVQRIYQERGHCTGFVVEYYLVSAAHCEKLFDEPAEYTVKDLARLKRVSTRGLHLRTSAVKPGERVYVIGYPSQAVTPKMVHGIVAGREDDDRLWYSAMTMGGFSGGAVVDKDGKVITIHSGAYVDQRGIGRISIAPMQAYMHELLK